MLEDQCLHGAFKLGIRRIAFDRPQRMPWNVIDYAGQVLNILDKEFLGIFRIMGQRLHHTEHLTHIGFRSLKDTLQFIAVKLATRLIQFTWIGQGSKLDNVLSFGFVMYIT